MSYDFNDHADWATQERETSEIAKCPVCGKDVKKSIWRPEYEGCAGSVVITARCCGMEATGIELWNQYAAAMGAKKELDALREAVEWLLDCLDAWRAVRMGGSVYAEMDALELCNLARAEVDRLLQEEN